MGCQPRCHCYSWLSSRSDGVSGWLAISPGAGQGHRPEHWDGQPHQGHLRCQTVGKGGCCRYVCLSDCLFVCLSVCFSISLSVCLIVWLSVCLCLSDCLFVCLTVCLSVLCFFFVCIKTSLSVCLLCVLCILRPQAFSLTFLYSNTTLSWSQEFVKLFFLSCLLHCYTGVAKEVGGLGMSLIFRLSLYMYVCMFVCIYVYVCLSESVSEFGSTVYVCSVFPPFTDYCKFHFLFWTSCRGKVYGHGLSKPMAYTNHKIQCYGSWILQYSYQSHYLTCVSYFHHFS